MRAAWWRSTSAATTTRRSPSLGCADWSPAAPARPTWSLWTSRPTTRWRYRRADRSAGDRAGLAAASPGGGGVVRQHGPAIEPALRVVAPKRTQHVALHLGLDALGHDRQVQCLRHA